MARNEFRNDRQAAFGMADDVTRNAPREGAHFRTPGPRRIRRSRFPVWAWLALSFFVPLIATLCIHLKG